MIAVNQKEEKIVNVEPIFKNISSDADSLDIVALSELGLSSQAVSNIKEHGIHSCGGLRFLSQKDLINMVGVRSTGKLQPIAALLEKDIISLLSLVLDKYRDTRDGNVYLRRSQGETLQEIADNPLREDDHTITRERVRQIERSFEKSIMPFLKKLFYVLKGSNNYVMAQDLLEVFHDDAYDQILMHACKSFEDFEYLDFAEAFVEKEGEESAEQRLWKYIVDIVGDGIDIYENMDTIDAVLMDNNLQFIRIEAIFALLKKHHYSRYGNFIVKGRANYATTCMHIIRHEFKEGIKLSQSDSEQSEDLIKLRKMVKEKYQGLRVPSSDRSLSSTLVRSGLVLRGRGQYISPEYVMVDESLLHEVKDYIDKKQTDRIYYNEIYSYFQGALNEKCGVDNYNYLHGILALRYPDEYGYFKDYLLKNGVSNTQAESIADRIYKFICIKGRPVSKNELFQEFRGFTNVMIIMPFVDDKRLLQWDYNYYTCTGILEITDDDILYFEKVINSLFKGNNGYASDNMLYRIFLKGNPEFLQKNGIKSEMNLHYIAATILKDKMDFRRPHIGEKGKIDLLSTKNVALYLLGNPDKFTFDQYMEIVDKLGWSRVTASAVIPELEESFARVSVNEYMKKETISVNSSDIRKVSEQINARMDDGILPLWNLEFDDFPKINYEWNVFLLETIIKKYLDDYIVVQPNMKDRRYQKGIIVKKEKGIKTYPQIVASKMKSSGVTKMTESQFLSFVLVHNLAQKVIPDELSNSDYVKKEGEYYCVVDM